MSIDLPPNPRTLLIGDIDLRTGISLQPLRTQIRVLGVSFLLGGQSVSGFGRFVQVDRLGFGLVRHAGRHRLIDRRLKGQRISTVRIAE